MAKVYDNFSRLPIDKMAQTITDMTYLYENTVVPKSHYKKQLDTVVEMAMEQAFESALLEVYVKSIKRLQDDSPKLYIQAMICVAKKINPMNMRPNESLALDLLWAKVCDKKMNIASETILEMFEELLDEDVNKNAVLILY